MSSTLRSCHFVNAKNLHQEIEQALARTNNLIYTSLCLRTNVSLIVKIVCETETKDKVYCVQMSTLSLNIFLFFDICVGIILWRIYPNKKDPKNILSGSL